MILNHLKNETEIKNIFSNIKRLYSKKGFLITNNQKIEIKNINLGINENIKGNFELITPFELPNEKCNVKFKSNNGFKINIECYVCKNLDIVNLNGLSVTCTKGKCVHDENVQFYSFIENLELMNFITDFETETLSGIQLILCSNVIFPKINGFFYKESLYSNKNMIKEIWQDLYFLLKLYSAGQAFNNIECILSDSYCEISISRSNLNFVKNHYSCFYVDEKDNLLNFIKSSYPAFLKEKDSKMTFLSFIHYMSILLGNRNDFDLLASFVALEILAVGNGILLDEDTFLQDRLDKLLCDLRINKESLNNFFAKNLKKLEYTDYLRCLIDHRNKVLHGVVIDSQDLALLINNFLTIILLKILNINCLIYLPLLDEIHNSQDFINQFTCDGTINKTNNEKNIVRIFKDNDELYLPLTIQSITQSMKVNDRYRIITFKTLGENGRCLHNIKLNKQ